MANIDKMRTAVRLSARPKDTFPELARLLADLYAQDPASLQRFIAASGMGRRKAYYLVELGRGLEGLKLVERVRRIGWKKAQMIAQKITRRNARERLQWAEENTVEGLTRIMHHA